MNAEVQKENAAKHALNFIEEDMVVGVGTGSTVNYFIDALKSKKHLIEGAVASSLQTQNLLKEHGIPLIDTNTVSQIDVYVDGADEANHHLQLIKGGGAALTGEKVLRALSKKFVCIIDESKKVDVLGSFPVPIEVLKIARSYVARELVKLGGDPAYREGVETDYGNIILDVHNLKLLEPVQFEEKLNQITGIVTNGIFAKKPADVLIVGKTEGVDIIK